MPSATPFLMFQGDASEALDFYASVLPQAEVSDLEHWPASVPGAEGKVYGAVLTVAGLRIRVNDSPVEHAFSFTPSSSIFIDFDSEAELDETFAALLEDGEALMALGNHGFSRKFGWVNDRFGVSWQLNLPS